VQTDIHFSPSFAVALVDLAPGEVVRSEAGAMLSMTDTVEIATDTQGGETVYLQSGSNRS
jgi:uncharacterized protein (AIM24 family)